MNSFYIRKTQKITCYFLVNCVLASGLFCVSNVHAEMDPRFEIDPQTLTGSKNTAPHRKSPVRRSSRVHTVKTVARPAKQGSYTIKPGDNLFKILMRDYGLSNNEAESFVEEIKRENNIYDIKRLKVGQKIVIPTLQRNSDGSLKVFSGLRRENTRKTGSDNAPEQSFKLESPVTALSDQELADKTLAVWNQIVPSKKQQLIPLKLQTTTFSLTLDPRRYPTFDRMDGGRIILDQDATIPQLVKSLIEDKDASVKIVSGAPSGPKQLMASLLEVAGFYSVEENFTMEFGVDPKLTIKADFKVEKTAESLIKQDIVLVNSGRTSLPSSIAGFLKGEGFSLYEPFASVKSFAQRDSRTIQYISVKKQPEITDAILSAFSVLSQPNRRIDVFAADNNGISLSVNAERYFERAGQGYVVTSFDGDPVNYTLFRILETKGYKVVILEPHDDFRKISEKLISRMKIKGAFAQQTLLQDDSAGYSLQMSGFKLDDPLLPGGGIFLTDHPMDRIIRELFTENGFNIDNR